LDGAQRKRIPVEEEEGGATEVVVGRGRKRLELAGFPNTEGQKDATLDPFDGVPA
jgi:hypothetical protein